MGSILGSGESGILQWRREIRTLGLDASERYSWAYGLDMTLKRLRQRIGQSANKTLPRVDVGEIGEFGTEQLVSLFDGNRK